MDASLRKTAAAAEVPSYSRGGETRNNRRTYVLRGQLVAQPFETSARPPVHSSGEVYGKVNSILNPPNAERRTQYSAQHNSVAVTVQTAGTVNKRKVPFSVNAPRNRLNNPEKKRPPPFSSTLDLKSGSIANSTVYPYRTISRTVQKPLTQPMESRIGWTNSDITANMARQEHAKLWR